MLKGHDDDDDDDTALEAVFPLVQLQRTNTEYHF